MTWTWLGALQGSKTASAFCKTRLPNIARDESSNHDFKMCSKIRALTWFIICPGILHFLTFMFFTPPYWLAAAKPATIPQTATCFPFKASLAGGLREVQYSSSLQVRKRPPSSAQPLFSSFSDFVQPFLRSLTTGVGPCVSRTLEQNSNLQLQILSILLLLQHFYNLTALLHFYNTCNNLISIPFANNSTGAVCSAPTVL